MDRRFKRLRAFRQDGENRLVAGGGQPKRIEAVPEPPTRLPDLALGAAPPVHHGEKRLSARGITRDEVKTPADSLLPSRLRSGIALAEYGVTT